MAAVNLQIDVNCILCLVLALPTADAPAGIFPARAWGKLGTLWRKVYQCGVIVIYNNVTALLTSPIETKKSPALRRA
jgi:hypothetical protein